MSFMELPKCVIFILLTICLFLPSATSFKVVYGGNVSSVVVDDLLPGTTYDFYAAALIPDRLELPKVGPATARTSGGEFQQTLLRILFCELVNC